MGEYFPVHLIKHLKSATKFKWSPSAIELFVKRNAKLDPSC
jgi:hypothetical protein